MYVITLVFFYGVYFIFVSGLKALYTAPKEALESFLGLAASSNVTLFALSSKKATQLMTCVWNGQYDQHESGGGDDAAHAIELSPVLDGEESVRTCKHYTLTGKIAIHLRIISDILTVICVYTYLLLQTRASHTRPCSSRRPRASA